MILKITNFYHLICKINNGLFFITGQYKLILASICKEDSNRFILDFRDIIIVYGNIVVVVEILTSVYLIPFLSA